MSVELLTSVQLWLKVDLASYGGGVGGGGGGGGGGGDTLDFGQHKILNPPIYSLYINLHHHLHLFPYQSY